LDNGFKKRLKYWDQHGTIYTSKNLSLPSQFKKNVKTAHRDGRIFGLTGWDAHGFQKYGMVDEALVHQKMVAGIFSQWFHVVGEVHVLVGPPEGGPHEGVSPRVFWNFKRTHEKENLTDINSFSCSFLQGKVGTYKNRRISPGIMVQGSSPGGDPSKTHN
jgi:hypothetical protein